MATASPRTKRFTVDDLAAFPDNGRLRGLVPGFQLRIRDIMDELAEQEEPADQR